MQPRKMQSPPSALAPSTMATFLPDAAATRAAWKPALPPPIVMKSYCCGIKNCGSQLARDKSRLQAGFGAESLCILRGISKCAERRRGSASFAKASEARVPAPDVRHRRKQRMFHSRERQRVDLDSTIQPFRSLALAATKQRRPNPAIPLRADRTGDVARFVGRHQLFDEQEPEVQRRPGSARGQNVAVNDDTLVRKDVRQLAGDGKVGGVTAPVQESGGVEDGGSGADRRQPFSGRRVAPNDGIDPRIGPQVLDAGTARQEQHVEKAPSNLR